LVKSLDSYQISEDSKNILNMAPQLLEAVVGIFAQANVPLPQRQYWMTGRPAEDCEQVVVSLLQVYLGTPGDQATTPRQCSDPRSAVYNISITREVPVSQQNGNPPTPASLQAASEWAAVDAWLLIDNLKSFDSAFSGKGIIATVLVDDPQGGVQSTNLNLTVVIP